MSWMTDVLALTSDEKMHGMCIAVFMEPMVPYIACKAQYQVSQCNSKCHISRREGMDVIRDTDIQTSHISCPLLKSSRRKCLVGYSGGIKTIRIRDSYLQDFEGGFERQ